MNRPTIKANKRSILGRKVKKLRREGILPANIFGKGVKSQPLQLDKSEFLSVFEKTGETGLVDLVIEKQAPRPVLISQIQFDPVTDEPLHVDFHQVNLKEKTTATVEIRLVGEAPAVEKEEGVLVQVLSEVEVEALPTQLPDHLEADISSLKAIDDAVRIKDLKVDKGVEIKAEPEEIVVKISAPVKEEEAPAPAEEEGKAEEGAKGKEQGEQGEKEEKGKEEAPAPAEEEKKS